MSLDPAIISVPTEQNSQKVDVSTTSAQSAVLLVPEVIVTVSALAFVVRGSDPTAVANTSLALAPNTPYRLGGIRPGTDKLAFIVASSTATAYITPAA